MLKRKSSIFRLLRGIMPQNMPKSITRIAIIPIKQCRLAITRNLLRGYSLAISRLRYKQNLVRCLHWRIKIFDVDQVAYFLVEEDVCLASLFGEMGGASLWGLLSCGGGCFDDHRLIIPNYKINRIQPLEWIGKRYDTILAFYYMINLHLSSNICHILPLFPKPYPQSHTTNFSTQWQPNKNPPNLPLPSLPTFIYYPLFFYKSPISYEQQQFYRERMKNIAQMTTNTPSDYNVNLSPNRRLPLSHKSIQNIEISKTLSKQLTSHRSVDTECTSESFDHTDQGSLSFIDEAVQYQGSQKQINSFDQIDLQASTKSQKIISQAKDKYLSFENTLTTHFKSTMKIDKYLRLLSSVIKTWRAYEPKTKLNATYKEIILARRVIRWQSKYDTIIQFFREEGVGMRAFKIMQLLGDLVDLTAYWLKVANKGNKKHDGLIDKLEQIESNFYFAECVIWFGVYSYRYFTIKNNSANSEEQAKEIKKKLLQNLLKAIKYIMDILTSYNNSSLKKIFGDINHKLAGFLTFFSSAIGIFLMWR